MEERTPRALASAIWACLALVLWAPSGGAQAFYDSTAIFVKYAQPTEDKEVRAALLDEHWGTELRYYPTIGWSLISVYWGYYGGDTPAAVQEFEADANFSDAQLNYFYAAGLLGIPDDPDFAVQWHLNNTGQYACTPDADIDAPEAWEFKASALGVLIGMIDDGFDTSHPDLALNVWSNPGEATDDCRDEDGNGYNNDYHGFDFTDSNDVILNKAHPVSNDFYTHGTAVAGVVAARGNNALGVAGTTWAAELASIRVFKRSYPQSSTRAVVEGIVYASKIGARVTNNSYSIGGTFEPVVYDAISAACTANQLFVAAAGNAGGNNDNVAVYPASYECPCIIAVAMTDCHDVLVGAENQCDNGSRSNYGAVSVDLAAPGRTWTTTFDRSVCPTEYVYANGCGTSVAAPQVTGAAALLWAQNPTWTNMQVKARILATVDQLESLHGMVATSGRLNLRKALDNQAPEAIDDLVVTMGRTTAVLTWTAPGNDGDEGTASEYEVAWSTSPITSGNFYSADTVVFYGPPQEAGSEECFDISGLNRCRTYYFAVRTWDDASNLSGLSNVPTGYRCDGSYAQCYCVEGLMAEGGGEDGWTPENSLALTTGDQLSNLCELDETVWPAGQNPRVQLSMLGDQKTEIDQIGLQYVDHDPTLIAVAAGDSCVVGHAAQVKVVESLRKGDLATRLAPYGRGFFAEAGDVLTVRLGEAIPGETWLVIESAGSDDNGASDAVGILVQSTEDDGTWQTLAYVYPRKFYSKTAVDTRGHRTLRLRCFGGQSIRSVEQLTAKWSGVAKALDLVEALQTGKGAVNSAIGAADGEAVSLSRGDTLELAFKACALTPGKARSYFLSTVGHTPLVTTARNTEGVEAVPMQRSYALALGPARPNPSLGSVSISYSLAQESPVAIRVYNVAGKLVRTLVSGTGEAGPHDVVWDARDDGGRAVPAGVYFYKMVAGSWQSQKKVVFIGQ